MRIDGSCDGGPGDVSLSSVHGELAIEAADPLVSEHRLLLAVVIPMQNEGQLVGVWVLLSSCDKGSSVDGDESSLNSQILVI